MNEQSLIMFGVQQLDLTEHNIRCGSNCFVFGGEFLCCLSLKYVFIFLAKFG